MKTPTTVLLVVIAALLAANLFVSLPLPQEAQAHPPDFVFDTGPTVVGFAAVTVPQFGATRPYLFRIWSDGMVEGNRFGCQPLDAAGDDGGGEGHNSIWCGWQTVPE